MPYCFLFFLTPPEISHSIQLLNKKITIPCGSETWMSLPTNVHFPLAAGSACLSCLMVGRPTALTYSVTYMTKANPPRSMLAVIHHVANMSTMIDGALPCRVSDFCYCHIFVSQPHHEWISQVWPCLSPSDPLGKNG